MDPETAGGGATTFYTLLAIRADGSIPVVELCEARSDDEARVLARQWLARHGSCEAAEIWLAGELIGKIRAPAAG